MAFFEAMDPIFRTYVLGNAPVKQIVTGFDWTEGPVWFGDRAKHRLFITATTSVYSVVLNRAGVQRP